MPNFKNGTQFLLPIDVFVTVDPEKWDIDMKEIMGDSYGVRSKRPIKANKGNREKVKVLRLLAEIEKWFFNDIKMFIQILPGTKINKLEV